MDEPISKSQKKRDADALQALGKKLTELSLDNLDKLPLASDLKDAIIFAKKIKSFGALRRHMQLIGKLMRREEDTDILFKAYDELMTAHNTDTAQFHEVEHWRARLISGGNEALTEFINTYSPDDIQSLRQHVKKASLEHQTGKPLGASRALFRLIRSMIL